MDNNRLSSAEFGEASTEFCLVSADLGRTSWRFWREHFAQNMVGLGPHRTRTSRTPKLDHTRGSIAESRPNRIGLASDVASFAEALSKSAPELATFAPSTLTSHQNKPTLPNRFRVKPRPMRTDCVLRASDLAGDRGGRLGEAAPVGRDPDGGARP